MFVARRIDNTVYGAWSVRQWEGQEELADTDPAFLAFLNPPAPTPGEKDAWCRGAFDAASAGPFDIVKLIKAKAISDLAFRLGVAPSALTPAQITAERNRIAAIYAAL